MRKKIANKESFFTFLVAGILMAVAFFVTFKDNIYSDLCANCNARCVPNRFHDRNENSISESIEDDARNTGNDYNMGMKPKVLSQEETRQTWTQVLSRPTEIDLGDSPVNSWKCIGPYGMNIEQTSDYYSGRVLGIEVEGVPSTRVGTASGGLWRYEFLFPVPITESATSQVIGAFATSPADPNKIIIGTGEPAGTGGNGTGLYKTIDGGVSWINKTLTPEPDFFYKIKYYTAIDGIIHAASNTGYYRSDNGGDSWVLRFGGIITDVEFGPVHPALMYLAKSGDGVYKSINGGTNWFKLTGFPVPPDSIGRASISVCATNDDFIYISVSNPAGSTVGIFRSSNQGINWHDVSYRNAAGVIIDYHSNGITHQGSYNNCIGVSPVDPNLVLAGGVILIRSTDGGTNWNEVTGIMHTDHHVIRWHSDGIRIWEGNDGGMAYSDDYGQTFSSNANLLPVTQFYDFDIGISGTNITVAGGTQDNAFPVSIDCKVNTPGTWIKRLGADAGSSKVDKYNPSRIMGVTFNSGNSLSRSTNGGYNWDNGMTGLDYSTRISNIEDDGTSPIYCYIGHGNKIFYSIDFAGSWTQFTNYVFPSTVWRINISKFGTGANIIYAIINNGTDYLRVYDSGTWYNRSAGLTGSLNYVSQHPSNNNIAYAITSENSSLQRISRTTNRGINWVNITGDLPVNVYVRDLVVNPTNDSILFAGTKYGMWKTTNSGTNWYRWTNGMPIANQIVRLKLIDSSAANGRFYVAAASFGRSIWIREGSGDDALTGIHNQNANVPDKYELYQNYPNPFNPVTVIKFSLPQKDFVELKIYDITGREVTTLLKNELNAGVHEIKFDGSGISTGIYFYRIKTEKYEKTMKMILLK